MEHKKIVLNGYILGLAVVETGGNITKDEYAELTEVFKNRPAAPDGYSNRLKTDLIWEQYELPIMKEDEEATAEDYETALAEMGVEV